MEFKFNLKGHLEKFKKDDGFDYEAAQAEFQSQLNNFDAKNKPDMEALKLEVKESATNDFIKSLGVKDVENVDQFNAHVKRLGSTSTELSEANDRLSKENETYKKTVEEYDGTISSLTNKVTGFERSSSLSAKGFNAKYSKAVTTEAESRMSDDVNFEAALELVSTEYPEWMTKVQKGAKTPPGTDLTPDEEDNNMRTVLGLPAQ